MYLFMIVHKLINRNEPWPTQQSDLETAADILDDTEGLIASLPQRYLSVISAERVDRIKSDMRELRRMLMLLRIGNLSFSFDELQNTALPVNRPPLYPESLYFRGM